MDYFSPIGQLHARNQRLIAAITEYRGFQLMLIKEMIEHHQLGRVITVGPQDNLLEMARVLCRHIIAAVLVVNEEGTVIGIATERDITRAILEYRDEVINVPVEKVMNYPVISCSMNDSALEILHMMTERKIRHIPVIEDGKPLSMVSIREFDFAVQQLQQVADTDELTGLANRRSFLKHLSVEISRFKRFKEDFSIAIMDIDHFKKVNDTYGHDVGDEVLKIVSKVVTSTLRNYDLVGRIGGEEFAILFPKTELSNAKLVCERIADAVRNAVISTPDGKISVTASFGLTSVSGDMSEATVILKKADIMLYQAKQAGRNRIEVSPAVDVQVA